MGSALQVYEQLFTDSTPERIDQLFNRLDKDQTGYVDYLEWSRQIDLEDIPNIVKKCRTTGPLTQTSLTEQEYHLLRRMMRRLDDLADAAQRVSPLFFPAGFWLPGIKCLVYA